jgi:DNA-binding response OmpR family regulator
VSVLNTTAGGDTVSGTDTSAGNGPHDQKKKVSTEEPRAASENARARPEPAVVLIAEDEEPIAEALAFLVEDAGYTPLVAAHGKAALELARKHRPRLVITDLMMPLMDGVELISALRADAAADGHAAPAIILTTAGGFSRADQAGADVVLHKPFDIAEVDALLRRFLGPSDST